MPSLRSDFTRPGSVRPSAAGANSWAVDFDAPAGRVRGNSALLGRGGRGGNAALRVSDAVSALPQAADSAGHNPHRGATGGERGLRGRKRSRVAQGDTDEDLGVARYGQSRRIRAKPGRGGAHRGQATHDAGENRAARDTNAVRGLARAMTAAAQKSRAARDRSAGRQDADLGAEHATDAPRSTKGPEDVARAFRQYQHDQDLERAGHLTKGDGRSRMVGGGQLMHDPQASARLTRRTHARAALATNMAQSARRAGKGHADKDADLVAGAYNALAAGVRGDAVSEAEIRALTAGAVPQDRGGNSKSRREGRVQLIRAGAAELKSADYRGTAPQEGGHSLNRRGTKHQRHGAAAAQHLENANAHLAAPSFRGFTQVAGETRLGASDRDTFGLDGTATDTRQLSGAVRMGLKSARYDRVAKSAGDDLEGVHSDGDTLGGGLGN